MYKKPMHTLQRKAMLIASDGLRLKLIVPWSFPIWCHVAMFLCVCVWSKQKSISTKGSSFYASNNKIQTQLVWY
jgi:hypothetical protein